MLYLSIDTETGGLKDESLLQVSFVADCTDRSSELYQRKVEDLPSLTMFVKHDTYELDAYCLGMHSSSGLLERLARASAAKTDYCNSVIDEDPTALQKQGIGDIEFIAAQFQSWLVQTIEQYGVLPEQCGKKTFTSYWARGLPEDQRPLEATYSVTPAGKNFSSFDRRVLEQAGFFEELRGVTFRHRAIDPATAYFRRGDKALPDLATCLQRAGIDKKEVAHDALEDALDVVRVVRHFFRNNP